MYFFIPKSTALTILLPLTLGFSVLDIARVYHEPTRNQLHGLFGWLLRNHERDDRSLRLTGATYVLLSACLFIWVYPKVIFITAFSVLIVSDTFAALVGRKIGKHPFFDKSLEGTVAFFMSALVVVAVAPKAAGEAAEYAIGGVAALVGAVVEASFTRIDDNLSIPLSVGIAMWLLYFLFLPAVNVYALDFLH